VSAGTYFGKYRGVVTDIQDPMMQNRIKASVPDVFGSADSGWALACLPFAGGGMGFVGLPKVGSAVWIEFEHGDPEFPIWTGCWVGAPTDLPSEALAPPYKKIILKTEGGHKIILDDTPGIGGITLETSGGQKVTLTAMGVQIDNGQGAKVALTGPQVSVNDGALQVI
jgi:uncharacterized protein involved in type VI secretion and phage assembly